MKKIYYLLGLLIVIVGAKSLINAMHKPLSKEQEKKALLQFAEDMQAAVDADNEKKAKEIIANAEAIIPTFAQIGDEDKANMLSLLYQSLSLFKPVTIEKESKRKASEERTRPMELQHTAENERVVLEGALAQIQLDVKEGNQQAATRLYKETIEAINKDIKYLTVQEKKNFLNQLDGIMRGD